MITNIAITSVATLTDPERKAVAVIAAAACPPDEFPRAVLTVGVGDIEAAIAADQRVAVFWIPQGDAHALIGSPALHRYVADHVPIIVLCRAYSDAQTIAGALVKADADAA